MKRTLVFSVLFALAPMKVSAQPAAAPIFTGETSVPAGGYVAWCVENEGPSAKGAMLAGELRAASPRPGSFAVAVLDQADFESWKKGYQPKPYFMARRVKRVDVRARLPEPGTYYVVVSNPPSATSARTVRATLQVFRTGAAPAQGASSAASPNPRRDLMSFGVVLAIAVVLALWSIRDGRGTEGIEAEKRAA